MIAVRAMMTQLGVDVILMMLIAVPLLAMSEEGVGAWDIRVFLFVAASRILSMELLVRGMHYQKRLYSSRKPFAFVEYILVGLVAWVICQSIVWSVLVEHLTIVPTTMTYPLAGHLSVLIGSIFTFLYWSRERQF